MRVPHTHQACVSMRELIDYEAKKCQKFEFLMKFWSFINFHFGVNFEAPGSLSDHFGAPGTQEMLRGAAGDHFWEFLKYQKFHHFYDRLVQPCPQLLELVQDRSEALRLHALFKIDNLLGNQESAKTNGQIISNFQNLTPQIISSSFVVQLKTSSASTPYYS